jgi:hypothetical protein
LLPNALPTFEDPGPFLGRELLSLPRQFREVCALAFGDDCKTDELSWFSLMPSPADHRRD